MAFLLELIPVIAEAIGEGAFAAAGEGAAATAAAAASESAAAAAAASEAAAAAAETASAAAAAGDAAGATAAASEAGAAAVEAGSSAIGAGTGGTIGVAEGEGLGSIIWQNVQAFAKWAAKEALKGALFDAAMRGLKATIYAIQLAGTSPEANEMAGIISNINDAHRILNDCKNDWLSWLDSHYDSRASYGSITVEGVTLQNFQLLQQKVGDLGIFLQTEVSPLIAAANKAKDIGSIRTLNSGMIGYAEQVRDVNGVVLKMGSMLAAGLKDHDADINIAEEKLGCN